MEPKVDLDRRDALLLFTEYAIDLYGTMMTDNPVLAKACAFQHRGALLLNKSHIPYSLEKEIYSATKSLVEGIELQLNDVQKFKSHEAIYQPNTASSNSQVFTSSLA